MNKDPRIQELKLEFEKVISLAMETMQANVDLTSKIQEEIYSYQTKINPVLSNPLMTEHEKTMFGELHQAVPECYIFVQVALGAILQTKSRHARKRFNRLIADFVITDNNFNILAVIELDDKSHDNKQEQDAKRDAMLHEAGYKVLRYRYMPDKQKLRNDILG